MFVLRVCLVAALGGLLFGYDTAVISDAIGFLQVHFKLDATMKGWAASSALLGCVIGVSVAGVVSDFAGRKKTQMLAGILFLVSAVGTAAADTFSFFVVFRVIGGVGVGVASMASPMYIAEISPARVRGRLVSVNQFAIATGMVVTYFVNYFIALGGDPSWNEARAGDGCSLPGSRHRRSFSCCWRPCPRARAGWWNKGDWTRPGGFWLASAALNLPTPRRRRLAPRSPRRRRSILESSR